LRAAIVKARYDGLVNAGLPPAFARQYMLAEAKKPTPPLNVTWGARK
jgi:hypothetical protein